MADRFSEDLIALLPRLRRFALSLCRVADLADDLVQLTAERALAARDRFDPTSRLEPWLFRILRNAWLDIARRRRTAGLTVELEDIDKADSHDGVATVEATMMLRSVEEAMDALLDDHRAVLHLVCIEELSYAEAAQVLGTPDGTVMSRLARARLALAGQLGMK